MAQNTQLIVINLCKRGSSSFVPSVSNYCPNSALGLNCTIQTLFQTTQSVKGFGKHRNGSIRHKLQGLWYLHKSTQLVHAQVPKQYT